MSNKLRIVKHLVNGIEKESVVCQTGVKYDGKLYPVPSDYALIDYIEQTGTATPVDTGLTINLATVKIMFDGYESAARSLFGCATTSSGYFGITGSGGNYRFDHGSYNYSSSITLGTTRHKFIMHSNIDYCDGTLLNTGAALSGTAISTLYFLARSISSGTADDPSINVRCHAFAVCANGTDLSLYYQPVKRKSDNAIGLYDLVSGTFITNATWTGGSEIDPTITYSLIATVEEDA